ncbi:ankyrin repeat and SOCS box protein 13-like isoform X2 [Mytilus edulis]|uniref:ankyrin repeat and SOCS box protein 13-like isoform X2 n=1 Tax=Mytilus edulis TaxID=6550 RepID=UPI0039F033AE
MAFELLLTAINNGNREQVEYIYLQEKAGNDPDFSFNYTDNVRTPLCAAAASDNIDIVRLLLSFGADPNLRIEMDGTMPLHLACDKEKRCNTNTSIVKELIDAEAYIDQQNAGGVTPIHLACSKENIEIVECLLEEGADCDSLNRDTGETTLVIACCLGNLELINMLTKYGCRIDYPNNMPLITCISRGNIPAVTLLLEKGEDIHKRPGDYLSYACDFNRIDMMEYLRTLGIDVNSRRTSTVFELAPLHVACMSRSIELRVVEKLLSWDADVSIPSATGDTALHYAAQNLDINKAKIMILHGANVNAVDDIGLTPLTAALTSILDPTQIFNIIKLFYAAGTTIPKETVDTIERHHAKKLACLKDSIELLNIYSTNPHTLKDICRIKIRSILGKTCKKNLSSLLLPKQITDYLNFGDMFIPDIS